MVVAAGEAMKPSVIVVESDRPTVAIRLLARAGARVERLPGVAWLTGRMLGEGTVRADWSALAEEVESRGASLSPFGGAESIGVAVDALAADWELGLGWALEVMLSPRLPADRFELARRLAASELQSIDDHPEMRAAYAFRRQLFGVDHPRGRPLAGDAESLGRAAVGDCVSFHHQALAGGALIVVVGPAPTLEVEKRVEDAWARLGTGYDNAEPVSLWPILSGPERCDVALPGAEQASLLIGHLGVPRAHPDRRALELASVVLGAGAGLSGRIPHRVREREGLAYAATGSLVAGAGLDPGRVEVSVGTGVDHLDRAELVVREELERFAQDGPTEQEVEEARAFLLGTEALRRETSRQLAAIAADAAFYGLDGSLAAARASLLELDRAAVTAAVQRHLDPQRLMVTRGIPA